MAKYAKVINGVVDNIIRADADPGAPYVEVTGFVSKGYLWDGSQFSDPLITPNDARAMARVKLITVYQQRAAIGNFNGVRLLDIRDDIVLAELLFQKGATSFPAISGDDALLLDQAKVNAALTYINDCAVNAQALWTTLQGLSTVADIKTFMQTTVKTGWPLPDL
jgi:hypothetical protein